MKKLSAVIAILCVACFAAMFLVACAIKPDHAEKPISISEQLGLRPIDPTPVVVALVNPDDSAIHAKNVIEPKDWQLTNAEWLQDDAVLELSHTREMVNRVLQESMGSALSSSFPIQPGCYYFQIDQKTPPDSGRSQVTVGDASLGFFQDAMYANWNPDWTTFSHFFRISETEDQMQIGMKVRNFSKVHVKNINLLPAQALLNLAPKGQPLQDIYWGKNAVSRTEPTGVFLPLGRMERIDQDFRTKQNVYHFRFEKGGPDPWGLYPGRSMERTVYPSASIEARPIEKRVGEPVHGSIDEIEEMILKFELRPISIGTNGEFDTLTPIRFLSGSVLGNVIDEFGSGKLPEGSISWSTDGETWNALKLEMPRDGRWPVYPPVLPAEIFPCERFYLKFKQGRFQWLRVQADLDTDQYNDYGQTSYFRVVPGEAQESGMKINPLYTARNQVYFLYRNDSKTALPPEFSARLGYSYSGQAEPKEVVFHASGNTTEEFDDIACRWEVLGDDDKIPPSEERICVFTLETSKLRASSHAQRGPSVSDVFNVEFDLGTYKMINEQMRFFPPRLAIE